MPDPMPFRPPLREYIAQAKRYAEAVLDHLPAQGETTAALAPRLEEVRALAEKTIEDASSSVHIGVVGEFDAGKSLLIGALLGQADALPVSDLPTTGNITALRLRTQPGRMRTEVQGHQVEWLDHQGALECLTALLDEADRRAEKLAAVPSEGGAANRAVPDRQKLAALKNGKGDERYWRDVIDWCQGAWDQCGAPPNPNFRNLLRELTWLARCCGCGAGRALLTGKERAVCLTADEIAHALRLPQAEPCPRFDELKPAPAAFSDSVPQPITAEFLQSFLPLVRRVSVEVLIPPEVWDLGSDDDAPPFLLLDFPGLGADNSYVRDAYLCQRELQEVETILMVVKGSQVGGNTSFQLYDRLQENHPRGEDLRDHILLAINRFDQLPGDPPENPGMVNPDNVRSTVPVLHRALSVADRLHVEPHRVVLTSALAAVDTLAGSGWDVASEAFLERASRDLGPWNQYKRGGWLKLADHLAENDHYSTLARQLRAVCDDGGRGRLQVLLVDHVAEHGLQQLYDRVLARAGKLREAYEKLPRERTPSGRGRVGVEALKGEIQQLRQCYERAKDELDASANLRVRSENGQEVAIEELLGAEVRKHIWDQLIWKQLLGRMKDGSIQQSTVSSKPGPFRRDRASAGESTPADSLAFEADFAKAIEACWALAEDYAKRAVPERLDRLASQARAVAPNLIHLLDDPQLDRRLQRIRAWPLEGTPQDALSDLRQAIHLDAAENRDYVVEALAGEEKLEVKKHYPLAGTKGDEYPQSIDWSTTRQRDAQSYNDHFLLTRLRTQLVKAARFPVLQRAQQLNQRALAALKKILSSCDDILRDVLKTQPLLHALAGDGASEGGWFAADVRWPFPSV